MKNKKPPRSLPRNTGRILKLEISMAKKPYSEPKLFISKKNGLPSVDKGSLWYVYFYTRDEFGDLKFKHNYSKGINRLKSIKERKRAGESLRLGLIAALERGWLPGQEISLKKIVAKKNTSLEAALNRAFQIKSRTLKISTLKGYEFYKNIFIAFHDDINMSDTPIKEYTIDNFYVWLDFIRFEYLKDDGLPLSGTSINNAKRSLSALFTVLKNERYIDHNFIKEIPALDQDPVNNQPFTAEQLTAIKKHLITQDPYLLNFSYFIVYQLLRPREICRLTVGDISLTSNYLTVETKTEARAVKKLSPMLLSFLEEQELNEHPSDYQLFSNKNRPKQWSQVSLKGRVDHFGVRFRSVKDALGLDRRFGLYSFRHTAIMNLYESLRSQNLNEREIINTLMPITGHRSEVGLKSYLRNILKSIPKDHSSIYTLDY